MHNINYLFFRCNCASRCSSAIKHKVHTKQNQLKSVASKLWLSRLLIKPIHREIKIYSEFQYALI